MRILGEPVSFDFTTHDPLTGQVSDADALPICEVFENDTDAPILTPAVIKRVGKTGNYRLTFVASEANGFELVKSYNVIAAATVGGITAKARVGTFALDSKRVADLYALSHAHFRT